MTVRYSLLVLEAKVQSQGAGGDGSLRRLSGESVPTSLLASGACLPYFAFLDLYITPLEASVVSQSVLCSKLPSFKAVHQWIRAHQGEV